MRQGNIKNEIDDTDNDSDTDTDDGDGDGGGDSDSDDENDQDEEDNDSSDSNSSSSSTNNSSFLLNPNDEQSTIDGEGISLLRQIFPDESMETLRELHLQHVQKQQKELIKNQTDEDEGEDEENDGRQQKQKQQQNRTILKNTILLPSDDFLRLPTSVAVRRSYTTVQGDTKYRYEMIQDLQKQALKEYPFYHRTKNNDNNTTTTTISTSTSSSSTSDAKNDFHYFTVVLERHAKYGLGLSLREIPQFKCVRIVGLPTQPIQQQQQQQSANNKKVDHEGNASKDAHTHTNTNPALAAGIQVDDFLIGINGSAFSSFAVSSPISKSSSAAAEAATPSSPKIIKQVIQAIQSSPSPVVLHMLRCSESSLSSAVAAKSKTMAPKTPTTYRSKPKSTTPSSFPPIERTTSLLDSTSMDDEIDNDPNIENDNINNNHATNNGSITSSASSSAAATSSYFTYKTAPIIHPFAKALSARSLIRSAQDEKRITQSLQQFTERARQWESTISFRIDGIHHEMVPQFDPKDLPAEMAELLLVSTSSSNQNHNGQTTMAKKSYTPSTPTLTHDSPLIPVEYMQAFFGMDDPYYSSSKHSTNQQQTNNSRDLNASSLSETGTSSSRSVYPGVKAMRLQNQHLQKQQHQYHHHHYTQSTAMPQRPDIFVPLYGIRKALSPRIVNIFVEGDTRVAYTIWVYDVESGKEWYAPIRYFQDFCDLRTATVSLAPENVGELEFPKQTTKFFFNKNGGNEANESEQVRQTKARQLEHFLRGLCSMIYTCNPLHPEVAEISIHVQSFLGVEAGLAETDYDQQEQARLLLLENNSFPDNHTFEQWQNRMELKRSIQRYTWRLFLLNTMRAIVNDFVDTARERGPKLKDIEALLGNEAATVTGGVGGLRRQRQCNNNNNGRGKLKARALSDLERIQNFLDQLVDLILEGCHDDFQSIASRREYGSIRPLLLPSSSQDDEDGSRRRRQNAKVDTKTSTSFYWDRLVREAVREQVEIEVYVPLRSVVSRLLVNGWRHEDMEVQFKIKELRKRPQGLFRIPPDKVSPSHWQSVALILKRGVGMSTLPCAKLRAIVEAAREISRLYEREHNNNDNDNNDFQKSPNSQNKKKTLLGADDFLPIFIFCVVRAEMERPCALCVLLQTLCDRMNRIGEIGYFLASFEAAIAHIQEIDLTEDKEAMLSFLSVPLMEVPLGDSFDIDENENET